jgi:hypothetical protein
MAGIAVARCPLSPLPRKVRNTHTVKTKTPRAVCGVLPFALIFVSCDSIGASHDEARPLASLRQWANKVSAFHCGSGTKQAEGMFKNRGNKNAPAAFLHQARLALALCSTQPISIFGIIALGSCLISTLEPCRHYQTSYR